MGQNSENLKIISGRRRLGYEPYQVYKPQEIHLKGMEYWQSDLASRISQTLGLTFPENPLVLPLSKRNQHILAKVPYWIAKQFELTADSSHKRTRSKFLYVPPLHTIITPSISELKQESQAQLVIKLAHEFGHAWQYLHDPNSPSRPELIKAATRKSKKINSLTNENVNDDLPLQWTDVCEGIAEWISIEYHNRTVGIQDREDSFQAHLTVWEHRYQNAMREYTLKGDTGLFVYAIGHRFISIMMEVLLKKGAPVEEALIFILQHPPISHDEITDPLKYYHRLSATDGINKVD